MSSLRLRSRRRHREIKMNRVKDATLVLYLIMSTIYFIGDALIQGFQFGAWGFMLFPIAGLVAFFRCWDLLQFVYNILKNTVMFQMTPDAFDQLVKEQEQSGETAVYGGGKCSRVRRYWALE